MWLVAADERQISYDMNTNLFKVKEMLDLDISVLNIRKFTFSFTFH